MKNTIQGAAEEIAFVHRKETDKFVEDLIMLMQNAHNAFAASEEKVCGYLKGKPDRAVLRRLVKKQIENRWGDDEMLPLLARVLVNGDFAF